MGDWYRRRTNERVDEGGEGSGERSGGEYSDELFPKLNAVSLSSDMKDT